jgi:hypothetical protein
MLEKLILIFIAGIFSDILVTKYTSYVSEKKITFATISSGLITVVNFAIFIFIIQDNTYDQTISGVLALAGGNGVGTFLALKKF